MERRLVTGKKNVEMENERAGRGRRGMGSEGDKQSRSWAWRGATIVTHTAADSSPRLYSVLLLPTPADYNSFQESKVFPQDLRLISGIQNLSALLSAKTSITT